MTTTTTQTRRMLALALAAPPLVWIGQGALGWWFAEEACPHQAAHLSFGAARLANGLIGLVAVIITVAAILYARRVIDLPHDAASPPKAPTEKDQRARYVAIWVLFVGVTLALGLIMFSLPSLVLRACGETR
jgi:hypothetical protein